MCLHSFRSIFIQQTILITMAHRLKRYSVIFKGGVETTFTMAEN